MSERRRTSGTNEPRGPQEGTLHRSVLLEEVVELFVEGGVDLLLDATVGAGGHSEAFLDARSTGSVVGLDRDEEMLERARKRLARFGERARLYHRSYAELAELLDEIGVELVGGALFDLGASSVHFDSSERGFSFLAPGPLDMRYDRSRGPTAEDLVNGLDEEELVRVLQEGGEDRFAKPVARSIVAGRPIRDTLRLADVVARAVGRRGRTHPATRTFQALRIAVNEELSTVEEGVASAIDRLEPGGRLAVISFHSGEDRVVKRLLKAAGREGRIRELAGKPVRPTAAEVRWNPRARSARMRTAMRSGASPKGGES